MSDTNAGSTDYVADQTATPSIDTPSAASSTPAPQAASSTSAPASQSASQAPVIPAEGQPPQFQPDWKFKVKDKEFEIDEWARGIAKDEDTYKKLKRVWERHHGLDEVLSARDQYKQKYEQAEPTIQEYKQITARLNEISHYYNTGDMDSFFETLQIPFDKIFDYVRAKAQASQLPPDVQERLEKSRQANRDAYTYKQKVEQFEQTEAQLRQERTLHYLEDVIQSKAGDVSTKYNEMMGDNSAFRTFVVLKGQSLYNATGQHLPAEQVVEMARQDLAKLFGTTVANGSPQAQASQPAHAPGQNPAPPVIPSVKAGAQSPVRTPPKSIDDLKKLAQQL